MQKMQTENTKSAQKEQKVLSYDSTHTHTWPVERLAVNQRRRGRAVSFRQVSVCKQVTEVVAPVVCHNHLIHSNGLTVLVSDVPEAAGERWSAHLSFPRALDVGGRRIVGVVW